MRTRARAHQDAAQPFLVGLGILIRLHGRAREGPADATFMENQLETGGSCGGYISFGGLETGVITLAVPGGYQSQNVVGCFPFAYHGGDLDHGRIMRPGKANLKRARARARIMRRVQVLGGGLERSAKNSVSPAELKLVKSCQNSLSALDMVPFIVGTTSLSLF